MASVIWLGVQRQKSLKEHIREGGKLTNPWDLTHTRPVIAKGNRIEGIEARE